MRAFLLVLLLVGLVLPLPAGATGGQATFRIVTTGDVYIGAFGNNCRDPSYEPPSPCYVTKNTLGYDGLTSGTTTATASHVNHAFSCAVTSSATGIVGNALPYPANMAIADSIVVGFDLNGDTATDTRYGGRIAFPSGAPLQQRIIDAVAAGDPLGVPGVFLDWVGAVSAPGPTPHVEGNVDGARIIIFNQGGSDVTVECAF